MPAPRWLQVCWKGTHHCGRGLCSLLLWSLWLVLTICLGIQIFIMSAQELAVPRFVLREIESRLEAAGLRVSFGEAQFDPGGHILLRDADLTLIAVDEAVFHAEALYFELNPITLWFRQVEPRQIKISDAAFYIPSMLSPTGTREPLVRKLNATVRPGEAADLIVLENLTAILGPTPVDLHGSLRLPARGGDSLPVDQLLESLARNYLRACRLAATYLPQVPRHRELRVSLELIPDEHPLADIALRLQARELELSLPQHPDQQIDLQDFTATTTFDLGPQARLQTVDFSAGRIAAPARIAIDDLRGQLELMAAPAVGRFEPRLLDLTAHTVHTPWLDLPRISVRTGVATLPQVQAMVQVDLLGHPLAIEADLDVTTVAGRVRLATAVDAAAIALAGRHLSFDLPALLNWTEAPRITADLNLAEGGRPLRAEAVFSTGAVTARRVDLDATAARVTWQGTTLRADDILLLRGASRATGSYEMDTKSLDFRFLLGGRLEPSDIDGWFRRWWPNFWTNFQFPVAPPDASVEVSGRWKKPLLTRVWVQASAENAVVKDIALDRMTTRLFVRPGWADVLEFHAWRPQGEVRGSFTRSWRLPLGARWTGIEVHATGDSDLSPLPKLLGDLGERIAEPFAMAGPVSLQIDGRAEREDWGAPIEVDFKVSGHTSEEWSFFDFPLHGAQFEAHQTNERLLVAPFSAGATGGALAGRIEMTGDAADRRIAFDLNLDHAHLGETIRAVETWTAHRRGEEPSPESEFQQRIAEGVLDLSLSATGPAADPYGFQGQGAASIQDANLGELKLLGPLSTLLGSTLLNFSKLQLDNAYGDFELNGRVLDFDNIKLTGTRGSLDANGKYYLDTRNLDFLTRVRPFDGGGGNLLDAVFTPLTRALEVKLGGKLNTPAWTFVYGPTNFLRALTGSGPQADAPDAPSPPDSNETFAPPPTAPTFQPPSSGPESAEPPPES